MTNIAISAEGLSKSYRIGRKQARYKTLRETVTDFATAPLHRLKSSLHGHAATEQGELIWALQDVSFTIQKGDVVGIIGRNGAGKSTLLKILAQITQPTNGHAEIKGRVGSLLEVGTGFHPELTGRENIFLNGAILGMKRAEINRKFDEIVAFSEVEQFIDTPVKHYSSGMYMRLAFAVAAHLETEVLLVDEVLAVGDAAFQKKCLSKMGDIAIEGRTVLFVSHNLGAVHKLCSKALWIKSGNLVLEGESGHVIDKYCSDLYKIENDYSLRERRDREGDARIQFTRIYWQDENGHDLHSLRSGGNYTLVLDYEANTDSIYNDVFVSFLIKDNLHTPVLLHQTDFENGNFKDIPSKGQFFCKIPRFPLAQGEYTVNIFVSINNKTSDSIDNASRLTVDYGDYYCTGHQGRPELCKYLTEGSWELQGMSE